MSRFLVICSVASGTPEYRSFATRERDFDLCLISYEPGRTELSGSAPDYALERKGFKFPNIRFAIERFDLIEKYDYFWLPDADLRVASSKVGELFGIARQFSLDVCQPALRRLPSQTGRYSWEITLARAGLLLRYSDFVEIMCPLFSANALRRLLWTFDLGYSGWGLDVLWPRALGGGKFAIVDAIQVEHPGEVGSEAWQLPNGLTPDQELAAILRDHCLDLPEPRTLGEVLLPTPGRRPR